MKHVLLLLSLLFVQEVYCQEVLKWMNVPGTLNNMGAPLTYDEILNLHGPVKEFTEYVSYDRKFPTNRFRTVGYDQEGRVVYARLYDVDNTDREKPSYKENTFTWDTNGELIDETVLEVEKGDTLYTERRLDYSWFDFGLPDPIEVDSNGNSLKIEYDLNVVYTFYDSLGRKVRDSVPENLFKQPYQVFYKYLDDRVESATFNIGSDQLEVKVTCRLDEYGNWIEMRNDYNDPELWPVLCRREYTYY